MERDAVFAMKFAKVFPLLLAKAQRKGRTRQEVYQVTTWLTGYSADELDHFLESDLSYGEFFQKAPCLNEKRHQIKGAVCGVKVETIEDPLLREIRYLDKLVDELAKGKPMDKILRD